MQSLFGRPVKQASVESTDPRAFKADNSSGTKVDTEPKKDTEAKNKNNSDNDTKKLIKDPKTNTDIQPKKETDVQLESNVQQEPKTENTKKESQVNPENKETTTTQQEEKNIPPAPDFDKLEAFLKKKKKISPNKENTDPNKDKASEEKKTSTKSKTPSPNDELLEQIRGGKTLKKASDRTLNAKPKTKEVKDESFVLNALNKKFASAKLHDDDDDYNSDDEFDVPTKTVVNKTEEQKTETIVEEKKVQPEIKLKNTIPVDENGILIAPPMKETEKKPTKQPELKQNIQEQIKSGITLKKVNIDKSETAKGKNELSILADLIANKTKSEDIDEGEKEEDDWEN